MTTTETPQPEAWERQPSETAKAFTAFRHYLEAGPERSLAKSGRSLGVAKSTLEGWSVKHRWQARVAAFEAHAVARADEAHLDAVAKRSKRQAELAQLHGEMLALPTIELLNRAKEDRQVLKALSVRELAALAVQAARAHMRVVQAERLALGVSTENVEPPNPMTEALERAASKTDEELERDLAGLGGGQVVPITAKQKGKR